MSLLSDAELKRLESKYAAGITSTVVVKIFQSRGERFSEATLRKYVQLGLLPTSRRVGIRGRHRGSSGLYPPIIVRLANQIKKELEQGCTLEDIRTSPLALSGDIALLRRTVNKLLEQLALVIKKNKQTNDKPIFKQMLSKHQKVFDRDIKGLEQLVARLSSIKVAQG